MIIIDGIAYDNFGGYSDLPVSTLLQQYGGGFQDVISGPPTSLPNWTVPVGFVGWRCARIGKRWVLVTPDGNACLQRSVYRVDRGDTHPIGGTLVGGQNGRRLVDTINTKYGGADVAAAWSAACVARLRKFHFNSISEGSYGVTGIAGEISINVAVDSTRYLSPGQTEYVKNIGGVGGKPAPNGLSGSFPGQDGWPWRYLVDCFDPKYTAYANRTDTWGWGALTPDPNTIVYQADDGDFLFFFSSGHGDETGFYAPDQSMVPHGGFVALISRPTITTGWDYNGVQHTWTVDTLNHTKRALLDFLIAKYSTIAALNAAWGTGGYYTTFESAGGWGVGTGLADEDGVRPRAWLGKDGPAYYQKLLGQNDAFNSTTWGVFGSRGGAVKADLDQFLGMMMDAYLKPLAECLQRRIPGALFVGHSGVGHHGAMSRRPVWESYGRWLNILRAGSFDGGPTDLAMNQQVREWVGRDIPWITAVGYMPAGADSAMYYAQDGAYPTQDARGLAINRAITAAASWVDRNGIAPVVGNRFWGFYDQPGGGEDRNWGIISYNDNAYDGGDYRVVRDDPHVPGRRTATEDRLYGDCLGFQGTATLVRRDLFVGANIAQHDLIVRQFGATSVTPVPVPTPAPSPSPTPTPTGGPTMPTVTCTVANSTITAHVAGRSGWNDQLVVFKANAHAWPAVAASSFPDTTDQDVSFPNLPAGSYDVVLYLGAGGTVMGSPAGLVVPAVVPIPLPPPTTSPTLEQRVSAIEAKLANVKGAL